MIIAMRDSGPYPAVAGTRSDSRRVESLSSWIVGLKRDLPAAMAAAGGALVGEHPGGPRAPVEKRAALRAPLTLCRPIVRTLVQAVGLPETLVVTAKPAGGLPHPATLTAISTEMCGSVPIPGPDLRGFGVWVLRAGAAAQQPGK